MYRFITFYKYNLV